GTAYPRTNTGLLPPALPGGASTPRSAEGVGRRQTAAPRPSPADRVHPTIASPGGPCARVPARTGIPRHLRYSAWGVYPQCAHPRRRTFRSRPSRSRPALLPDPGPPCCRPHEWLVSCSNCDGHHRCVVNVRKCLHTPYGRAMVDSPLQHPLTLLPSMCRGPELVKGNNDGIGTDI